MNPDQDHSQPDAFEKRVRFGCGFLFGAVMAFLVALREVAAFTGTFWAVVIAAAVVSGFAARRYGDEFWHQISKWWP